MLDKRKMRVVIEHAALAQLLFVLSEEHESFACFSLTKDGFDFTNACEALGITSIEKNEVSMRLRNTLAGSAKATARFKLTRLGYMYDIVIQP